MPLFFSLSHAAPDTATPASIIVNNASDVMGGQRPKLPVFPKLALKPGFLRGFARDSAGKPLVNARILISSPAIWGRSGSQSVRTDARGYYEIKPLSGGCTVRFAGYSTSYGGKIYGLPLHAVDGQLDSIDMAGEIENFVLLAYGFVSRAAVADSGYASSSYYGGAFTLSYSLKRPDEMFAGPSALPEGGEIEVTFTPRGSLLDGSAGHILVIRKKLEGAYFSVNNIPIGCYALRVKLLSHGGGLLRVSEQAPAGSEALTPAQADGEVVFQPRAERSGDLTCIVQVGGMRRHELWLEPVS
ncbi:MAG TPA: carboxypeptidase-like regulatory domain-containing protein [Abditibacterium sp.]